MPNILNIFNITEIGVAIVEKPKITLKKIRSKKIEIIIENTITLTEVACLIET